MTRPVYERCMEVCNEKGACQHPSGCMVSFKAETFHEAARLIDTYKFDASFDDSADGAQERNAIKQNLADMLRARAEGKDYPGMALTEEQFLQAASGYLLATGKTSLTMADLNDAMQNMRARK